ncbi:hypothetical protein J437_LFUL018630 [Ladona fulva]|uniref:Uncharacterized protein n=1 Tax=Ladona fulva TaxID=123851 RepID=A0A8K0KNE0_LADFU|nr:hypothetical protein J437_LFUL018630 [Ladona fulva]
MTTRAIKKDPMWKNHSLMVYKENAPRQNTQSIKILLAECRISVLEHPSYLTDISPCDSRK